VVCSKDKRCAERQADVSRATVRSSEAKALISSLEDNDSCIWREMSACCSMLW